MNIIILGVRIIEDSDNRGSDNRGCTVDITKAHNLDSYLFLLAYVYGARR